MKDKNNLLAHLLAADEHPPLREEPAFQDARKAVEADPGLQQAYEEAKAFFDQHPALIRTGPMPDDVRKRIEKSLEKSASLISSKINMELSPWTIRTQFAWAALLVLLLAGMSVLSSIILDQQHSEDIEIAYQNQPPQDAFRSYVGNLLQNDFPELQERNPNPVELISWIQENGRPNATAPTALMTQQGMGCANLIGPNGKVSMICFKVESGILHLFITDNQSLQVTRIQPPVQMKIQQREALQWNDEENTYLLITHEERQKLPELFL